MFLSLLVLLVALAANATAFFGLRRLATPAAAQTHGVGIPFHRRALFAAVGPIGCYLTAASFITIGVATWGRNEIDETSMRVAVAADGPAATAGIREHDKIVTVEGAPIHDWAELRAAISKHPNEQVRVGIERDTGHLDLPVTPSAVGKIGVGPHVEHHSVGIGTALGLGLREPVSVWVRTWKSLGRMVTGQEKSELAGPVGVVGEVRAATTGEHGAFGQGLIVVGLTNAYYLWIPCLIALVLFPRRGRAKA